MSINLLALINEGEAIVKDAADAHTRQGQTTTHIRGVLDWHRRAALFIAARDTLLAHQVPPIEPTDSFDDIFVALTTTLNLLKTLSQQQPPVSTTDKGQSSASKPDNHENANNLEGLLIQHLPKRRSTRIAVLSIVSVGALALLLWGALPENVRLEFFKPIATERALEKTIEWPDPILIARNEGALMFNLAEAIPIEVGNGAEVRIDDIAFSANVASESPEAFGFDLEVLMSGSRDGLEPAIRNGSDPGKFQSLRENYVESRRVVKVTVNTGENRAPTSAGAAPIVWQVNALRGATNAQSYTFKGNAVTAADNHVYVQLFAWTLWGGDHAIELRDTRLTLKLQVKRGGATATAKKP